MHWLIGVLFFPLLDQFFGGHGHGFFLYLHGLFSSSLFSLFSVSLMFLSRTVWCSALGDLCLGFTLFISPHVYFLMCFLVFFLDLLFPLVILLHINKSATRLIISFFCCSSLFIFKSSRFLQLVFLFRCAACFLPTDLPLLMSYQ